MNPFPHLILLRNTKAAIKNPLNPFPKSVGSGWQMLLIPLKKLIPRNLDRIIIANNVRHRTQ